MVAPVAKGHDRAAFEICYENKEAIAKYLPVSWISRSILRADIAKSGV
jgi:hypothetical protein